MNKTRFKEELEILKSYKNMTAMTFEKELYDICSLGTNLSMS